MERCHLRLRWQDERAGFPPDLYFTSLERDGAPAGPQVPLTATSAGFRAHDIYALAWSGDRYLAAWRSDTTPFPQFVHYQLLDANGTPLTPVLNTGGWLPNTDGIGLAAAWVGDRFVMCWQGRVDTPMTSDRALWLSAVDANGVVVHAPSVVFSAPSPLQFGPGMAMVSDGQDVVLLWVMLRRDSVARGPSEHLRR